MTFTKQQNDALALALTLHERVKTLANRNTNGEDKDFSGKIMAGESIALRYDKRTDECHRGINFTIASDKYWLWFECKGWVVMEKNNERVYSQRPREDISGKFEGDMNEFITVASKVIAMIG